MYQLLFNGFPIYDPRDEDLCRSFRSPNVHLAVGEAGTVSFTVDHDHPNAGQLTRLNGTLELRDGATSIFKGRIKKDTRDLYLSREIEAEGLLACLNDSVIPPFNFPGDFTEDAAYQEAAASGNVVKFLLGWFLDQHNSQVKPAQRIQLGEVTVTDPNNYISRASSEYLTTMEAVRKKLKDLMGGYLLADYSGEVPKLHYYADLPLTNIQTVEFGENLLDLISLLDAADTYTAILPLGTDGLTLESLPDGEINPGFIKEGRIIYSAQAEDTHGCRITRTVKWDDVTEVNNLQTKALARIQTEDGTAAQTITVKAADLGEPHFVVGRYVKLQSTPHGFSAMWPLTVLDPDILDPGNTDITLGATVKAASDIAHSSQSNTQEKLDNHQIQLNKQMGLLTQQAASTLEQITSAIQTSTQIMFSALEHYVETENFEQYQQTVKSQMDLLSDQLNLSFTELTSQIVNVNGDLQQTVELLEKHFEFAIDGLTIKAGENAMTLKLDNGLISFQKNGVQFGWWDGENFHTGNIVVEVNERAQFGNFAAIPRADGGLSWLKVKG